MTDTSPILMRCTLRFVYLAAQLESFAYKFPLRTLQLSNLASNTDRESLLAAQIKSY
jgi:hypothetical protein